MARTKKASTPTSGVVKGTHLTVTTGTDGKVDLKWDWDVLLKEVAAATKVSIDIVAETEKRVRKTRKKKEVSA